jgi:predicted NodU family carbamoyl transferase
MITLGINYSQMHDSSACIVRDGELLFAVSEERISRAKHDASFPKSAIRACLDFAGADQLDSGYYVPRRSMLRIRVEMGKPT